MKNIPAFGRNPVERSLTISARNNRIRTSFDILQSDQYHGCYNSSEIHVSAAYRIKSKLLRLYIE